MIPPKPSKARAPRERATHGGCAASIQRIEPLESRIAPAFTGIIELSTLTAAEGFKIKGVAASDYAGFAVSAAGDINGDGLDDLVVGAYGAGAQAGASYVVFGQRGGLGASIDLSALNGTNGFKLQGETGGDFSGVAVSKAGDINKDGIDDLIIGAHLAAPNGAGSGASYVVFGSRAGFTPVVQLGTLNGVAGFKIQGEAAGDLAGLAVSGAGDINGDGTADLIIGASQNGIASGKSYVVFGKMTGFAPILNLSTLTGPNGFKIQGEVVGDEAGRAVSRAGDVNGDGIDDLLVGAHQAGPNGVNSGASYVIFGSRTAFAATLNLSALNGANGFKIQGEAASDFSGFALSAAGDINGDGIGDILIGARKADTNGNVDSGASYVVFGKRTPFVTPLNLSTLAGANGFKIQGEAAGDYAGGSVSAGGDVNGDGVDDLLIGAKSASPNAAAGSGSSYVVFGHRTVFGATLNLLALNATTGIKIHGAAAGDQSGIAVSGAGDINGDGFADVLVGAYSAAPNGTGSGAAYVIYGQPAAVPTLYPAIVNLAGLPATSGVKIQGEVAGDYAGYSVSGAGDVNGDGIADLLIGAYGADPKGSKSGASYVVFGKAGGFSTPLNLSTLTGANGFKIQGEAAGDESSRHAVSAAGDVNGDGFADLLIGAYGADPNGLSSGASYVVFGQAGAFATPLNLSTLTGANGFKIQGEAIGDFSGFSVSAAGDVNGDGFADVLIGAYHSPNGSPSGASYVVFGKAGGFSTPLNLSTLTGANGFKIQGEAIGDFSGCAVSTAGDVNGDGFADLLIGARGAAPNGSSSGASYVIFGKAAGFNTPFNLSTLTGANGFKIQGRSGRRPLRRLGERGGRCQW